MRGLGYLHIIFFTHLILFAYKSSIIVLESFKKHRWIHHKKIQHYTIASDYERTSEAIDVLFNNQTFNNGHRK